MHGVLTGPAAYLEHLRSLRKAIAQHRENGLFVALASFGEGQHVRLSSVGSPFKSNGAETARPGPRTPRAAIAAADAARQFPRLVRRCALEHPSRGGARHDAVAARGQDQHGQIDARQTEALIDRENLAHAAPDDRRRDARHGALGARGGALRRGRAPQEPCAQPARHDLIGSRDGIGRTQRSQERGFFANVPQRITPARPRGGSAARRMASGPENDSPSRT